jgi:CelD/BcsL family acetyltransferase involved in cellulose biosynthesis
VREVRVSASAAEVAIDVEVHAGFPAAIDQAAAGADPRHGFLRRAWFEATGGEGAATLVATRADGRVVAALPTAPAGPALLGLRAVPGSYWPYRSFPVALDASDEELAAFLSSGAARRALGRAWRLGPVYEDDPTASRLLGLAARAGWTALSRRLGTSYRLDIAALQAEGSWPRTATLRKNRWIEKRLAELGDLEWERVSGSGWNEAAFEALAEIERNSWVIKKTDGTGAKFATLANCHFWEAAVRDPCLADMISAAMLRIGGTPAAFAFSIHTGLTRYNVANSYDERFARHSPGRALLYRDFQQAIEAGTGEIGWGSGDAGYKTEMGAVPGPEIVDLLFVRNRPLAGLLRPFWERSGNR